LTLVIILATLVGMMQMPRRVACFFETALRSASLRSRPGSSRVAAVVLLAAVMWWPCCANAAEPLLKPSRVSFDPAGALVIDGRKVFPINLTVVPPPEALAPNGKRAYEEFCDGGVLFLRTGGPHWDDRTLAAELQCQETAAQCGLRCCPWIGWELGNIKPGNEKLERQLRGIIDRLKESPGMGLWKGADEPAWGKKSPTEVAHTAEIIHHGDPSHPIWLVQAPRGTASSLKPYDAGWDVGGIDIYPVSYPPGRHSEEPNKELSMVGDFARLMREAAGGKPYWMTLQIAFSGTTPPKGVIRFPTFFEERFMAYEAIINGSRGLSFFGGGLLPTLNERDRKLGWNWTYWERVLEPLLEEIGSRSILQPALTAPDSKAPIRVSGLKDPRAKTAPDAGAIEWLAREVGGDFYLFACKKEGPTIEVRFSGLPKDCATGRVLFEEPRQVEAKDGSFDDWFGPHDVHVYWFGKRET
jgi:hypothetical protein